MTSRQDGVTFRIDPDGMVATMHIPTEISSSDLDLGAIAIGAQTDGVEVGRPERARIEQAIVMRRDQPETTDFEISTGVKPEHGADGWLEWMNGFEPIQGCKPVHAGGRVDHYGCISFRRVTAGAHFATIRPPTEGTDGRTVTGKVLKAVAGVPSPIQVDPERVDLDRQGRVTSKIDGIIELNESTLRVAAIMRIEGSVDFSTGNIGFGGSVEISGGVRDRFVVRAGKSIEVKQVVDAATIDCGGDFICESGMAGKERGLLRVGGNARVGYLKNVRGVINGDLAVGRELVNCRLVIGGSLIGEAAVLVGGELSVSGHIDVHRVGSENATPTALVVGATAILDARLRKLERMTNDIDALLQERRRRLEVSGNTRTRTTQLDELDAAMTRTREAADGIDRTLAAEDAAEELTFTVRDRIHTGVKIVTCDTEAVIEQTIEGPLTIRFVGGESAVEFANGEIRPLTELASVLDRAA